MCFLVLGGGGGAGIVWVGFVFSGQHYGPNAQSFYVKGKG